jgi:hypothetical protein
MQPGRQYRVILAGVPVSSLAELTKLVNNRWYRLRRGRASPRVVNGLITEEIGLDDDGVTALRQLGIIKGA